MKNFDEVIGSKNPYSVAEVVRSCRDAVKEDLKNEEILKLKKENTLHYEDFMAKRYPNFSKIYPSLFDKLITDPHNLPYLDYMLNKIKETSVTNKDSKTQEVVDYLAENK